MGRCGPNISTRCAAARARVVAQGQAELHEPLSAALVEHGRERALDARRNDVALAGEAQLAKRDIVLQRLDELQQTLFAQIVPLQV